MTAQAAHPVHSPFARHGATRLASVDIDGYNAEIKDSDGEFIGDRASNKAFRAILEDWRERIREVGEDPLGDVASHEISKKKLDKVLAEGDPEAAGLVHGVIEDFAKQLSAVTARLLRTKDWKGTERVVVGGGLRASRVGELAIGRASVMLKGDGHSIDLLPIRNHPDQAGLLGTIHLAPSWIFTGYDGVLAVDIGGSNIRAGIVALGANQVTDLSAAAVHAVEIWRHCEDKPKRDEAVDHLVGMLRGLVKRAAKDGIELAPFIGVGCPGVIEEDGSIARGGQNLPGNWESSRFNLPELLCEKIAKIGQHHTHVVMHNDAVVQGLSEVPIMSDVEHWGVLTIGTGLGNARFTSLPVASRT